jgi:glycosyltransferase involved in cell wall biosynthesis
MTRILVHFARFGPYHHARLRAAHEVLAPLGWEVMGLETAGTDATYAWDEASGTSAGLKVITVFPGRVHEEITAAECKRTLHPLLDSLNPDAIAIAGWASPDALSCLSWCRKHDRRRIVMSETREADGKRAWWKELIKRRRISRFDSALVGGKSHRDYLVKLGMPTNKIHFGYNVVDNAYFAAEAEKWRSRDSRDRSQRSEVRDQERDNTPEQSSSSLSTISSQHSTSPSPYFLASNRFIERKNLARLIEAYGVYVKSCQLSVVRGPLLEELENEASRPPNTQPIEMLSKGAPRFIRHQQIADNGQPTTPIWPLVLLGDGELKPALIAQCHHLGLTVQESAPWDDPQSIQEDLVRGPLSVVSESLLSMPRTVEAPQICDARDVSTAPHRNAPTTDNGQPTTLPPHSASSPTPDPCPLTPGTVFFPGFRQIEELPRFYAHAGCFVHPAYEEPWGLVLNEAMACGLPILSGKNVGAAEELVRDGSNGFCFEATSVDEIAGYIKRVTSMADAERMSMGASSSRILDEVCSTTAFGIGLRDVLAGERL